MLFRSFQEFEKFGNPVNPSRTGSGIDVEADRPTTSNLSPRSVFKRRPGGLVAIDGVVDVLEAGTERREGLGRVGVLPGLVHGTGEFAQRLRDGLVELFQLVELGLDAVRRSDLAVQRLAPCLLHRLASLDLVGSRGAAGGGIGNANGWGATQS